MTTLTATDARKTLFHLLRGANERHENSVRLSYQDRIVYSIHEDELLVVVLRV